MWGGHHIVFTGGQHSSYLKSYLRCRKRTDVGRRYNRPKPSYARLMFDTFLTKNYGNNFVVSTARGKKSVRP